MALDYLEKPDLSLLDRARKTMERRIKSAQTVRHCLATLDVLASWKAATPVLAAGLLLPLVRNELMSEQELTTAFGSRAVQIARVAVRLIYQDATVELRKRPTVKMLQVEALRRLIIYAYTDVEAVLVCMAARLAYVPRLDMLNEFERKTWAQKNMDVFVPLMEMLGLWTQRRSLANFSLTILNPVLYSQLERHVMSIHERQQLIFDEVAPLVRAALERDLIGGVEVTLHETNPASLYQRMEVTKKRGEQPNPEDLGVIRIDVLLDEERDCYYALGLVHRLWKPLLRSMMPGKERFSDSIALPNYNGYRCLITTVITPDQKLLEFRIRTREMEQFNVNGVAAALLSAQTIKNVWWRDEKLKEAIRPATPDRTVTEFCALTPTGEAIYPVKPGSTVLDFAFRVQTAAAPYARHFWVNGRNVSPETEVRHRDLIEIEYDFRYPNLKPEWEDKVRTSTAKTNIRRFIKQHLEHTPHRGRRLIDEILERESGIYGMRFPAEKVDNALATIAHEMNCATLELLYLKVAAGEISPDEVVASMIEDELVGHIVLASGDPWPPEQIYIARCWMQEKEPFKWERASRVTPGSEIVGRITGGDDVRTLVVHRVDCRHAPPPEFSVPLRWRATTTLREAAEITITAPPRSIVPGMVVNAVNLIGKDDEKQALTLHSFNSRLEDGQAVISMVVDAPSFDSIHRLQDALKALQRSNYITDFKIWQLFPGQKMLIASDKRHQNPYTLRQIRDKSMFFGRDEEIERIIQTIKEGQTFVVLYGQKRIGKTSLLYQLAEYLLPQSCDVLPVQFDALSLAPFDVVPFLAGLADAAYRRIVQRIKRSEDRKGLQLRAADLREDPYGVFAEWVDKVQKRLQGTKLLFMVDEFTRAEEDFRQGRLDGSFFDGMQWLVGTAHVGFILCIHDHIYRHSSRSWGMLQRGHPVRLDTLDRASAARLVQQPLERIYKFSPEVVEQLLDLTDCHPYFLQALCLELTTYMAKESHERVTSQGLETAISSIFRTGDHYFNHFRNRTDKFGWLLLKTIAYAGGDNWMSSDEIRNQLEKNGVNPNRWQIAEAIGELYRADILEANHLQTQALYRIKVRLFQFWLRQGTNPIVLRDMQAE